VGLKTDVELFSKSPSILKGWSHEIKPGEKMILPLEFIHMVKKLSENDERVNNCDRKKCASKMR
jgi:hypothetical protein